MTEARDSFETRWRVIVVGLWLAACAALLSMRWSAIHWFALPDTDDNMRMSQVRALLAGQGWFDLRQYKLNPPAGFDIHWSRVVDLPIAAIELIVRPFAGGATAEVVAAAIAPLLPLGVAMAAMAVIARRLVAPGAFVLAVGLVLCCQVSLLMFMPLRVDHHGWQLALLIITIAGLADPQGLRGGITMGLSSALSLAIGLELMPFLAIAGAALVVRWVYDPQSGLRLRAYGAALVLGTAAGYLAFTSYASAVLRCDALSPVWLTVMVAAGVLAMGLSAIRSVRPLIRLGAAAACGVILAIGFARIFPQCLGRPEQISPELAHLWFDNIREAKPLYVQEWTLIVSVVALPVIGIIGSVVAVWRARKTSRFAAWVPVAIVSITSLLLVLWQMRQAPAAQLMAVPGATALAWAVIPRLSKSTSMLVRTFGVVAAFLIVSGLAVQLVLAQMKGQPATTRTKLIDAANARCPTMPALAPIARMPATTIFTFVDLGPRLITVTHHRAVAGPYHRNGDAILDVHHAFDGAPDAAHATMLRHGATLLMTCPNMNESTLYRARSPHGFYARLASGERFTWLTPVPLPPGSPFLLWRIG